MRAYLRLFHSPGVLRVTASQLLGRFSLGMLSIAVLLQVEGLTGSYGLGGLVVASLSVGQGVAMPIASRLAAKVGARRLIMVGAGVNAASMIALAFAPPHPPLLVLFGTAIGVSIPPIMPVVRALYPRLVAPESVPALFALDTSAQELIWIIGPVVTTLLATSVSPSAGLVAAALVTLAGCAWFVTSPLLSGLRLPMAKRGFGRVLGSRSLVVAMMASFLLVASFMSLEVGVVARFDNDGAVAGVVIAAAGVGSLVGGLVFGHRRLGTGGVILALAVVAIGTGAANLLEQPVLLAMATFVSGLGFAPALAVLYLVVSRSVPEDASAEAFGWLHTAGMTGGAAGIAVAGIVTDSTGHGGAFLVATVLACAATLTPLLSGASGRAHTVTR